MVRSTLNKRVHGELWDKYAWFFVRECSQVFKFCIYILVCVM